MLFTLHQWLELISIPAIGFTVIWLVQKFAFAVQDRYEARRARLLEKRLKEIDEMPD